MVQIEIVALSRVWDKSPAIEVYVDKKYQDQLRDDAMHHDLRILEVEKFQTILIRYAGAIYNVNIRELNYPDLAALQNQLLLDTELILPMQSLTKIETRVMLSKEVHPELPIRGSLPGYEALVQLISMFNPDFKDPLQPLTPAQSSHPDTAPRTAEKKRSYNETTVTASEINLTSLTVEVDDGPSPPKVASKVEVVRKGSTSSPSRRSSKVFSPTMTNWGHYSIPTYPVAQPSAVENIAITKKNEKVTPP